MEVVEETKGSFVYRYQFPVQDHAIDRALDVHDPRTKGSAGTLVDIDDINLTVDLKRGKKSDKDCRINCGPYLTVRRRCPFFPSS